MGGAMKVEYGMRIQLSIRSRLGLTLGWNVDSLIT